MAASDFTRAGSPITATGFNSNVAATRAATLNGTNGAMFDRNPMGDTTFFVTKQPRPIRDKKVSLYLPFTLRVVNIGTAASPTYRKLFYFPDHACDVEDGWAECDNAAYSGQETWAQDGKWFYVADADGDEETSRTLDQKKVEYVYLHVLSSYDAQGALRSAIVTNSKLIPEDFNGMRTDCICIGHFSVPTDAEVRSGTQPKVLEQFVQGQVQVYGGRFPLQLSVVNIGTEASPEWVKCFYFTDSCVYYDGDIYASCINAAYPGYTAGGEGLYFVAKADGTTTTPPLQEEVEYVYLHVKKVSSSRVEMIVTNDDETIPTAWNDEEDYCCCIGRFSTPSQAQVLQGTNPFVEEQFVRSQVQITPNTTDFPFEIRQINEGTESSPVYTTLIHIPDGAIKCCFPTYPPEDLVVHHDDWYTYPGSTSQIGLKIFLSFKKQETGEEPVTNPARCYWTLGDWGSTYTPEGVNYTYYHAYNYPLGFVRSDHTCYNLARSAITIPADFLKAASYGLGGGSGGGGGSYVTVTDSRTKTTNPGIVGFNGGVGSQASPYLFVAKDGIGPDLVFFDTTAGAEKTLIDYLSGSYEVTFGSTNLGANVTTEVFGELCLGPEQTPDIDPEVEQQDLAAPSAHVHTLNQIVNDAGETLDGEDVLAWFDDLGITGQISGEGNLLTDADIQTSADVYQKDGTASAGTYANLLALADHIHPLNAGTTHETYAYGDHAHGNITNDGKISGTPKGVLVVTDDVSGEITTGPSLVPAGWSETYGSDLELLDGLRECFGLYDAGGVTGYVARVDLSKIYSTYVGCLVNVGDDGLLGAADSIRSEKFSSYETDVALLSDVADCFNIVTSGQESELRIPTSRLTCDVDQHQNKCLLVADGTDVTHSGNDMYDAVEAVCDDYVDNNNVIPYVKKGSLTANSYVKTDGESNFTTVEKVPTADVDYGEGVENLTSECFGTEEGDVAEGNHYHGNISALGVLTYTDGENPTACDEGKLLVTGANGVIEQNSPSWTPAGISATDYEVLESLVSIFDYAMVEGSLTPTLSTAHLKYPSTGGHSNNCLLVVNGDGYVEHSGNAMYNAVDALETDYTEAGNKIPYWNVDASSTGLVYNSAGTISYKDLDAANGVAGLDANGKIAAERLPTFTASKWMKTDNSGNISVTTEVPLAIDTASTGVFYNTAGTVSYKALGTTSGTIAEGDHTHGNVTTDGKIVDTPKGVLLFTDAESGAITTTSSLIPAGWDFDNDVELLSAIVGNFTKTSTNDIKIPTSSLTCDVAQHSGNCILVAKGTEVTHSGNDMYNAADALTTDYKGANNKIPYWKVATDQTGVVFDTTGTITYKPLNAANGIAGLDGNGKLDAAQLPMYTGTRWMKTDASGNIATTNEVPLMVDAGSTGLLYNTSGTISYKALGTTEGTVAKGDHTHGNITTDGKITNAAGRLVVTDSSASIGAGSSITPNGWGYASDIDMLADLVAKFTKLTSGGIRLPTSSLTCDVDQHQNKCLLVADGTDVTHSGNRMYNMLEAATDADKDAAKILTDKDLGSGLEFTDTNVLAVKVKEHGGITSTADGVALGGLTANLWCKTDASGNLSTTTDTPIVASTSATGVVYNAAGTISYKPLNGANGVAGLDASSKLSIAQIPTGNTATTVAPGNHGHSDITSFPGFSSTVPGKDTSNGAPGSATTAAHGDHTHPLNVDATDPAAAGGTASPGSATTYARRDHVHAVKFATSAAAGQLVYVKDTAGTAGNHTTALYTGKTDIEVLQALGNAMSGIDSENKATFSASSVSDPNCTSGGDCLAYFDADKKLAHLGTTGITKSRLNAINASFDYTGEALSWSDASLKHDKIKYSGTTALTAPKVLGFEKDTAQHGAVTLLDVALLAPKAGDTGATSDNAPVADLWVGDSESAASKIARIGTSSYAARADHKHGLETGVGSATEPTWSQEITSPTEALDTTTWNPGTNGLKEAHCTRIIQQGNYRFFIFRNYTYSKNGNLIYRGAEYVGARGRYS